MTISENKPGSLVVGLPSGVILTADGSGVPVAAAAGGHMHRAAPGAAQGARSGTARGQRPRAHHQHQQAQ